MVLVMAAALATALRLISVLAGSCQSGTSNESEASYAQSLADGHLHFHHRLLWFRHLPRLRTPLPHHHHHHGFHLLRLGCPLRRHLYFHYCPPLLHHHHHHHGYHRFRFLHLIVV